MVKRMPSAGLVGFPPAGLAGFLPAGLAGLLLLCAACGGDGADASEDGGQAWVSELEYRFTGTEEQGVLFDWAYLRADPRQDRIFVLDARETQVSVWRPDGSLLFVVGRRGEGPGEFTRPSRIYFKDNGGFSVREGWGTRFTHYAADGVLVDTEIGVTTALSYQDARVGIEAPASDGGYVARPLFSASRMAGLRGGPPMESQPLLLIRRSDAGQWLPSKEIFWQNTRNAQLTVVMDDMLSFSRQYFGDHDHTAFAHGRIVVMRQAGGPPGSLDLLELNAHGDTLWERHLQFDPVRLTSDRIQEVIDIRKGPDFQRPGWSPAQQLRYLRAFEESLHKPEYLPAAESFFLSASDELWLKTFERSDTLRVYYTIPRGDTSGRPRRVLLPESMRAEDATSTHVWGIRDDPLGVPYVVGRRLKPVP